MKLISQQKGIGLVELGLVITVIGALILTIMSYFTIADRSAKVNATIQQINEIVEGSYIWVRAQPNFQNVTISKLADGGYINKNWRTGVKINPFGGDISVGSSASTTQYRYVKITMKGLTSNVCTDIRGKLSKKTISDSCGNGGTEYTAEF